MPQKIVVLIATWLSTIILAPFSYILTRRASSDKGFISIYNIYSPILNLFKNSLFKKDMTENKIKLNSIPEAINAIKNGEVIIVVDDANRENEGDFVAAAAEKITNTY